MNRFIFFQKFIKIIYRFICKIYNFLVTNYENKFYRKKKKATIKFKRGFFSKDIKPFDFKDFQKNQKLKVNKYLYIHLLNDKQIEDLIIYIFSEEFREYITNITGFNYSVDYMIMYDRKFIEHKNREVSTLDQWYSYKWHLDKPNSNNTLKIIYPLNITLENGPLTMIDSSTTKKIKNPDLLAMDKEGYKFTGDSSKIYGFFPARCIHKDGIPNEGLIATQIMFQLNPNLKWSINDNLNKRNPNLNNQLKIWTNEPKFTFISCIGDNRILLQ